jgi:hypothetical protein
MNQKATRKQPESNQQLAKYFPQTIPHHIPQHIPQNMPQQRAF